MENYSGIFWTLLVIIIAIISIIPKKNDPPSQTQTHRDINITQKKSPPPPERVERAPGCSAPEVTVVNRARSIYDYPKCPACRMRNLRGESQKVFCEGNGYRCVRGHRFM